MSLNDFAAQISRLLGIFGEGEVSLNHYSDGSAFYSFSSSWDHYKVIYEIDDGVWQVSLNGGFFGEGFSLRDAFEAERLISRNPE